MAKPKRKRNTNTTYASNKRAKGQQHPHGEIDPTKYYEARAILREERNKHGKAGYIIDWADDEETGQSYEPTWEPLESANPELIADWKLRQARREEPETPTPKRKPGRVRKVVEDTPSSSVGGSRSSVRRQRRQVQPPVESPVDNPSPAGVKVGEEIEDSQDLSTGPELPSESSLFVPEYQSVATGSFDPSPRVQIPGLPSSLDTGAFERVHDNATQDAPSEASDAPFLSSLPAEIVGQETHLASQVIPDSQSLVEPSTFKGFSPDAFSRSDRVNPAGSEDTEVEGQTPKTKQIPKQLETFPDSSLSESSQREKDKVSPIKSIERESCVDASSGALPDTAPGEEDHSPSESTINTGALRDIACVSPVPREPTQIHSEDAASIISATEAPATTAYNTAVARPISPSERSQAGSAEQQAEDVISSPLRSATPSSLDQLSTNQALLPSATPQYSDVHQDLPIDRNPIENQFWTRERIIPPDQLSNQHGNDNSQIESSFPFITQIDDPLAAQAQPLVRQSSALSEPLPNTARGDSDRPSTPSPNLLSSPFPSLPSKSRLQSHPGRAPQLLRLDMSFSSGSMKPVGVRPDRVDIKDAIEEVRRIREEGRERRRSFRPPPLSPLLPSSEQPISALPPNMIAEKLATVAVEVDTPDVMRSPSTVPAVEIEPEPTKDDMNTSERYETLIPQSSKGEARQYDDGDQTGSSIQKTQGQATEPLHHAVPIALLGLQRDHYDSMVSYERYHDTISRFLQEHDPSHRLVNEVELFVQRMRDAALQPDLDSIDALTQHPTQPERHAQWLFDSSSKFRFLKAFLDNVKHSTIRVAVLTHRPKLAEMLETFLLGSDIAFQSAATAAASKSCNDRFLVTVLSPERIGSTDRSHDVFIFIEPTDHNHVQRLGPKTAHSLYLTLVAPRTVEHIEMSLSPSLPNRQRLKALLTAILKFARESEAGRREPGQVLPEEAANACAAYIHNIQDSRASVEWPLVGLSLLDDLDSETQSNHETSQKRPLESVEVEASADSSNSKRTRLASSSEDQESANVAPREGDTTHISDSLGQMTQPDSDPERAMRQLLQEREEQLKEHVRALEDIQWRFEELRKELLQVKGERDGARGTAQLAQQRLTTAENAARELRTERSALKDQLQAANQRLLEHSIPERRELESMQARITQAEANEAKARRDVEAAGKEVEYVRTSYQDASSRAQELAAQKASLETRCAKAEQLASGEQARAQQLSRTLHGGRVEKENVRLRQRIALLELGTRSRDEEIMRLKEAGRGRISTRGNSVPRSRVGSPIKGRGSRQASPAAGELRARGMGAHPLRNG